MGGQADLYRQTQNGQTYSITDQGCQPSHYQMRNKRCCPTGRPPFVGFAMPRRCGYGLNIKFIFRQSDTFFAGVSKSAGYPYLCIPNQLNSPIHLLYYFCSVCCIYAICTIYALLIGSQRDLTLCVISTLHLIGISGEQIRFAIYEGSEVQYRI